MHFTEMRIFPPVEFSSAEIKIIRLFESIQTAKINLSQPQLEFDTARLKYSV